MNARLLRLWDSLRASYWFVPALMTLAAIVASQGVLYLDRLLVDRGIRLVRWLHGAGEPEGARVLLSTIAGSMITVAGVTFSILLVALSVASSQFGPRLLRGFLRDRGNQAVLGTFIAGFVYCLLVLRHVPMDAGGHDVPQLALVVALLLALAGVAVLIYFIHHAAASIQASQVIATAGRELDTAIRQTFPAAEDEEGTDRAIQAEDALPDDFEASCSEVAARSSGYVQEIDTDGLLSLATARDLVIELLHGRGSFVVEGRPLARVKGALDDETREAIADALVLGAARSSTRDVERGVDQLAEVAVRALSPGINDPFTAEQALRRLGQSLALLVDRNLPTPTFHDDDGACRLVVPMPAVADLLHMAFDQPRHYGRSDPHVPVALLEIITAVGLRAGQPGIQRELLDHAEVVHRTAMNALEEASDRDRVEAAYETATTVLAG
ncbi:MAG: DUF2254 domain-containing protein [Longimicrobiales bacterium]|nr:DUF2254 domain-containing protein [Longimicrobiales bacterium]